MKVNFLDSFFLFHREGSLHLAGVFFVLKYHSLGLIVCIYLHYQSRELKRLFQK